MSHEDQPSLLARIRALTDRIADYRHRFALPKGHKDRYETHGAAQGLQRAKRERQELQGKLDPIRLIATGISCRDCVNFHQDADDYPRPTCVLRPTPRSSAFCTDTSFARSNEGRCGPEARLFEPIAAHA